MRAGVVVRRGSYPQAEPKAAGVMTRAVDVVPATMPVEEAARLAGTRRLDLLLVATRRGWHGVTPGTLERSLALRLHRVELAALLWPAPAVGAEGPEIAVRRRLSPATPFVVVTAGGRPVGAVVRDASAGRVLPRSAATDLARLDRARASLLRAAGHLGEALGGPVAAVGGFARDLLGACARHAQRDLDLAVAGDGRAFARRLARAVGGRTQEHGAFLTATVLLPGGERVDVVTARRERYRAPGALPDVEPAGLAEDLARRDFAINAVAIRLDGAAWGEVLDPEGGVEDLRRGLIRVLHPLSFIEDPTRIFRAARFASRLGLRLEAGTARLARAAAALDVYGELSGDRVRAEMDAVLAEPAPADVLARLLRLGAFRLLLPGYRAGSATAALIDRVAERTAALPVAPETIRLLYLLALTAPLGAAPADVWAERLALPTPARGALRRARLEAPGLLASLGGAVGTSEAYARLRRVPEPVAAWAHVLARGTRVRRHLAAHLGRWRALRPLLSGGDLAAMGLRPGPRFGHLLEGLRAAQAAGRVATPGEARAWVRREIARGEVGKNGSRPHERRRRV